MSIVSISVSAVTDQEVEPPSMELLEFLAEWETDEGQWAGPEQFEDDSFDQLYDGGDTVGDVIENEYDNE